MVVRNHRRRHLKILLAPPVIFDSFMEYQHTSQKLRLQVHRIEGVGDFIVVGFDLA